MTDAVGPVVTTLAALISAGKSETLLAVSNLRSETLLALSKLEGRAGAAEIATRHVSDQIEDLEQTLASGFDRLAAEWRLR